MIAFELDTKEKTLRLKPLVHRIKVGADGSFFGNYGKNFFAYKGGKKRAEKRGEASICPVN